MQMPMNTTCWSIRIGRRQVPNSKAVIASCQAAPATIFELEQPADWQMPSGFGNVCMPQEGVNTALCEVYTVLFLNLLPKLVTVVRFDAVCCSSSAARPLSTFSF